MKILSHRGYWISESEKNSLIAFERSFRLGFGTETDVRDFNGQLVISHDVPTSGLDLMTFADFLNCYKSFDSNLPLALNIKSDGLQKLLKFELERFEISNYFVFDMSIPDTIGYLNNDFKVFGRESEYETDVSFYSKIIGVWMDEFEGHWINQDKLSFHLNRGKIVCLVSPDLHKRNYQVEWATYKRFNLENVIFKDKFWLCTDFPEVAKAYFYEN
jgi:hypothetical protein